LFFSISKFSAEARRFELKFVPTVVHSDSHADLSVLQSVLHFIASQPVVKGVSHAPKYQLHNHYARWVLQEGTTVPTTGDTFNTPFYLANLKGNNVVVGCGDSGIDYKHCMFSDSSPPPFSGSPNFNARKIVYYDTTNGDNKDDNGHGTHVAGTVLGFSSTIFGSSGMAPNAKIYFQDLADQDETGVNTPKSLIDFFNKPYESGKVRIHTNSWGTKRDPVAQAIVGSKLDRVAFYDPHAADIDYTMSRKGDLLILFAAGNDGLSALSATLAGPATCKNCISVRAASNTYDR